MINRFLDRLPWRIQSVLGYRPQSMISITKSQNGIRIKSGYLKPPIDCIYKVSTVEPIQEAIFNFNFAERLEYYCSDFSAAEVKGFSIYNYDHQTAVIFKNRVIKELSPFMNKNLITGEIIQNYHPVQSVFKLGKPEKRIMGKTLVLPIMGAQNNYFHFTLDLLPKIGNILSLGYTLNEFDNIIINDNKGDYCYQLLQILEIPKSKIIKINPEDHWEIEFGIVPYFDKHGYNGFWQIKQKILAYYKKSYTVETFQKKKIFVVRKKDAGRSFKNEDEIFEDVLSPLGYSKVYPENLSILEQIDLFYNASEVVLGHGAGMTNIVYCQPKTKIIEIHDRTVRFNSDYYPYIVYNQLRYGYLLCDNVDNGYKNMYNFKDLIINKDALVKLLRIINH